MSNDKKIKIGEVGIYDARQLGIPRMLILGIQHTFAMFGATVLVPILTGLDVSTTLLMAGLGTLLFHLITKGKVPAFLGSSGCRICLCGDVRFDFCLWHPPYHALLPASCNRPNHYLDRSDSGSFRYHKCK